MGFGFRSQTYGGIDLDPCADPLKRVPAALHYTKEQDGLSMAWSGRVYLNPPYSRATAWFKHLSLYVEAGAVPEALVLVPVTSLGSKGAALLLRSTASAMCLCSRRFNFLNAEYRDLLGSSPIPLCLVYVGHQATRFLELTTGVGYGLITYKPPSNRRQFSCSYCGEVFTQADRRQSSVEQVVECSLIGILLNPSKLPYNLGVLIGFHSCEV